MTMLDMFAYLSPLQLGLTMFRTPTATAYKMDLNVINRNMAPPMMLLPDRLWCKASRSSLYLGSSPTNSTADTWRAVVKYVKLSIPVRSPPSRVTLSTGHICRRRVEMADDSVRAALLTVVNMA